jgi:hypothetical protein
MSRLGQGPWFWAGLVLVVVVVVVFDLSVPWAAALGLVVGCATGALDELRGQPGDE